MGPGASRAPGANAGEAAYCSEMSEPFVRHFFMTAPNRECYSVLVTHSQDASTRPAAIPSQALKYLGVERPLYFLLAGAIILPVVVFLAAAYFAYQREDNEARIQLNSNVDILHEHAVKVFETLNLAAAHVDQLLYGLPDDEIRRREGELNSRLKGLVDRLVQIQDIWVIDRNGRPLVTGNVFPLPAGLDLSDREYYRVFRERRLTAQDIYVSGVLQGRVQAVTFFQLSQPRRVSPNLENGFAGVIAISVNPDFFAEFFKQLVARSLDAATLLRADGTILARYPPVPTTPRGLIQGNSFLEAVVRSPDRGVFEAPAAAEGEQRIVAYRKLPQQPIYILASINNSTVIAAWRATISTYLLYGVPATLGLIGLALTAIHRARKEGQALRQLAEKTQERDQAWNMAQDLLIIADQDGTIRAVNHAWKAILGWNDTELIGKSALDLVHPADKESGHTAIAHVALDASGRHENRYRHKDGSYRWISWSTARDGDRIYASGRNISAEKEAGLALEKAEAQLRQSQKMEAVGQLTGGIAHDFNNLLTVVIGNLDMLRRRLDENADARTNRHLTNALEGARRAAQLTQRLLAFSRQSPLAPETVDLNKLVSSMSDLLQRTLGENIGVETVLGAGLWRAEVDANQLENAILNLSVNARDAMPDGGKLTIETANTHLDDAYSISATETIKPGQYVMVCISDTGSGMTPEVQARVFEPFFTTKPVGKGTGLGLAQVYGFVRQSKGHVAIYSEPGEGTTIKLYFPRVMAGEERTTNVDRPAEPAEAIKGQGETILVVEDDPMVREFTVSVLEEAGYRILAAGDGPEALGLLEQHCADIRLLFTDVVLTGPMNGRQVADEAIKQCPTLKILYTTGYTKNAIIHPGRLDEGVELLSKPFQARELLLKVRRMLGNGS